jgi:hypothetical protein
MRKRIEYLCPNDSDIVLYVEHVDVHPRSSLDVHWLLPERPRTCPKCKNSFYKYECPTREGQP